MGSKTVAVRGYMQHVTDGVSRLSKGFFNRRCLAVCGEREKGGQIMDITDVRVRKVTKEGKMKAVVSITIDDVFVVHDIKVIEGEKGLFIAMPSRKATDGEYKDIAHPINSATREHIQRLILERYEQALQESDEEFI